MNEGSESMSKEYIEDRIEQLEQDNESLREQVNDLIAEVNDLYESDVLHMTNPFVYTVTAEDGITSQDW